MEIDSSREHTWGIVSLANQLKRKFGGVGEMDLQRNGEARP